MTTETAADEAAGRFECRPAPDHAGGAFVRPPPGTRSLIITHPQLAAVDIFGDEALREIDLRGCAPGLFLTVQNAPAVERIRVPESGRGAVFYMELGALEPPLLIEGRVRMLDLAARAAHKAFAEFRMDLRKLPPLEGIWLGSGAGRTPSNVGAIILYGGEVEADRLAESTALVKVYLEGCTIRGPLRLPASLRSLHLGGVDVEEMVVAGAPDVYLRDCPRIRRIIGNTDYIAITGGADVEELEIDGHVAGLRLMDVQCRSLRVPAAGSVELLGRHQVKKVYTLANGGLNLTVLGGRAPTIEGGKGVAVKPLTVADIEHEFLNGTAAGRAGMLAWARHCTKASDYWLALQVMASAIDTGVDPARVWECRCGLTPTRGQKRLWEWNFPDDLAIRGWTADVRLWLRCVQAELDEAIQFAQVIERSVDPAQITALLAVAGASDLTEEESGLLLELASRALEHGALHGRRLDLDHRAAKTKGRKAVAGLSAVQHDWMQRLLRTLLDLIDHPRAPELAAAYARWIARRAPTVEGVRLLGSLASRGAAEALQQLDLLRQGLDEREELTAKARHELGRNIALQTLLPPSPPFWGEARRSEEEVEG